MVCVVRRYVEAILWKGQHATLGALSKEGIVCES